MKRILYGVLAGFSSVLYLYTLTAAAAPPDRARGRAVGQNKSAGNDGSNGANVSGPYDPYGVGDPSGNGSDNGDANGKPCAGCVGNADSKNPPGQQPGPNDDNNGYECDGNSGIAQGNPAHSFCRPATTSSSTTSTTITTSTTVPVTTTSTSTSTTSTTSTTVPVTVTTTSTSTSTTIPTEVLGISVSRGKLPITGGDISLIAGVGSGLALVGTALTRLSRRK